MPRENESLLRKWAHKTAPERTAEIKARTNWIIQVLPFSVKFVVNLGKRNWRSQMLDTSKKWWMRQKRLLGLPPSFIASCSFVARHSRACPLPSLNLREKERLLEVKNDPGTRENPRLLKKIKGSWAEGCSLSPPISTWKQLTCKTEASVTKPVRQLRHVEELTISFLTTAPPPQKTWTIEYGTKKYWTW